MVCDGRREGGRGFATLCCTVPYFAVTFLSPRREYVIPINFADHFALAYFRKPAEGPVMVEIRDSLPNHRPVDRRQKVKKLREMIKRVWDCEVISVDVECPQQRGADCGVCVANMAWDIMRARRPRAFVRPGELWTRASIKDYLEAQAVWTYEQMGSESDATEESSLAELSSSSSDDDESA